jgi:hypothetical protein
MIALYHGDPSAQEFIARIYIMSIFEPWADTTDGMVEHDGHVGQLLKKLDDLGIVDNAIRLA